MKNKFPVTIILVILYSFSIAQSNKKNNGFHTFLGVDVDNTSIKINGSRILHTGSISVGGFFY